MVILHRNRCTVRCRQYRFSLRWVQRLWIIAVIFMHCDNGVNNQTWEETPGFKKREMIRPRLRGEWRGDIWENLTITYSNRDSVAGSARGGTVRFRGVIRGMRADITGEDLNGDKMSGYILRKTGTDSLFIGLRDSTGTWRRFFSMVAVQ